MAQVHVGPHFVQMHRVGLVFALKTERDFVRFVADSHGLRCGITSAKHVRAKWLAGILFAQLHVGCGQIHPIAHVGAGERPLRLDKPF